MIPHMKGLLVFFEMKQKNKNKKKIQNGRLKKTSFSSSVNSQYFFMKFSELENEVFLSRLFWIFWVGHCNFFFCFSWASHFEFFFREKIFFLLHLKGNKQPLSMRYHFFLHYGWFLQNLKKETVWTNMHTTVLPFVLFYKLFSVMCKKKSFQIQEKNLLHVKKLELEVTNNNV